ncbi:MAG: NEW3 domain-containing protein [Solirubrobacteraceae bacterium]|nr:NEW3 domain-containing protein [Solirubrobacteraceae bacterium]
MRTAPVLPSSVAALLALAVVAVPAHATPDAATARADAGTTPPVLRFSGTYGTAHDAELRLGGLPRFYPWGHGYMSWWGTVGFSGPVGADGVLRATNLFTSEYLAGGVPVAGSYRPEGPPAGYDGPDRIDGLEGQTIEVTPDPATGVVTGTMRTRLTIVQRVDDVDHRCDTPPLTFRLTTAGAQLPMPAPAPPVDLPGDRWTPTWRVPDTNPAIASLYGELTIAGVSEESVSATTPRDPSDAANVAACATVDDRIAGPARAGLRWPGTLASEHLPIPTSAVTGPPVADPVDPAWRPPTSLAITPAPRVRVDRRRALRLVPGRRHKATITVRNPGTATARKVRVTLKQPRGVRLSRRTINVGTLRPGVRRRVTVRITARRDARRRSTLRATVRATGARKATRSIAVRVRRR